jgi:hypothetical protein
MGKPLKNGRGEECNNHNRAYISTVFVVMAKITGAGYHEASAQDARRRIVSFFHTHLNA